MRKTKIVCTLGPACREETVLEAMLKNGMNVARLNLSHGTTEEKKKQIQSFRRVRDRLALPAAVLLDTKGPEIRIGCFREGRTDLREGELFSLRSFPVEGTAAAVYVNCAPLFERLKAGQNILLDDGKILLESVEIRDGEILCRVLRGGSLSDRKAVNIPGLFLDLPYLREQDREDLRFGIEQKVDLIAASFVRRKADVLELRRFLDANGGETIRIIAKIENAEGVENFEDILSVSDGIMIARGDMGVEIPFERLPGLQKRFIRSCYRQGKTVITATQMLESMVEERIPTRAEITDVANAVFDGTSAVMLSAETAVGKDPAHVVAVMDRILKQAETDAFSEKMYAENLYEEAAGDIRNAICGAACTAAKELKASALLALTRSGETARGLAKFRPRTPIFAFTPEEKSFQQLSIAWGICPVRQSFETDAERRIKNALDWGRSSALLKKGDKVVVAAGLGAGTDFLKLCSL